MLQVHFILLGEGSSDRALVEPLRRLCVAEGAGEVTGFAPDFGRIPGLQAKSLEAKLELVVQHEPGVNLIFIHRDADARDPEPRYLEIERRVGSIGDLDTEPNWVAIVPVQETEAWLLLDEANLRMVAGRPRGRAPLDLPRPSQIEAIANPKEVLEETLVLASETSGARRRRLRRDFPRLRRRLIERLAIEGPICELSAWQRLRRDLSQALQKLSRLDPGRP